MRIHGGKFSISVDDACLSELEKRRQLGRSPERGGQLFAEIVDGDVRIVLASDVDGKRSRFSFLPYRWREQREIAKEFKRGLHYVGDWHTHPEEVPRPSGFDVEKILGVYRESDHELPFLVMLIVGRAPFPEGLYAAFATTQGLTTADCL